LIRFSKTKRHTINILYIAEAACCLKSVVVFFPTGWPFSNTVCKMSGFVQGVSVSASVFTLVAIAVERFRCIVYPLQPKLTLLVAKVAIVTIWVLAVAIMCPAAVALTVEKVPFHYMVYNDDFNHTLPLYTCYENFANPQMRKVYTAVLFAHIYLIPLTVITLMYVSIGVKLCSSAVANREPQLAHATIQAGGRRHGQPVISQKKIKVIKMLIVVALLFMLSWLPLWTLMMMADYGGLDREQLDLMTSYIFPFAHWLAFSNSSVNPIVYGYYNKNFKRGFQAVCKTKPFCCIMHLGSRIPRWGRRGRSVQAPCQGTELRDGINNYGNFVLGLRNRVHNDNKLSETPEENRSSRVGCVVVHKGRSLSDQGLEMVAIHKKSSNDEGSEKVSSLAVSVYQAWDN
ncbi:neuropeptide FF receptor 1 like 2, partial [Kryptolebias marmoratus]|uniref:neuropeptide FF receptor 1 like 2 n=1 Tax=Kryptolebias marmoratus TaxID=37003 RepID=UPI0018ACA6D7